MSLGASPPEPEPTPPAPDPEPVEPEPEPEPAPESEEGNGTNGMSAIDKEVELAKQEAKDREEADAAQNEASAAATQAHREEFEASGRQAVHDQIKEAEAAMRGPNVLIGNPGDPTKGPSS